MNLTGKKVAVLGCGRSGISAARLALAKGASDVCIFDSSPHASCSDASLKFVPGATEEHARDYAAELVVLSPGIEADIPWTLAFTCAGAPIIGEIELGYCYYKGRIIAITGTNGKTTTTALLEHILLQAGKTAKACGNYGYPFCDVAIDENAPEIAVLEVSSFQMETIHSFRPEVAIWLNFAPDHMDRYTKVEDYFNAKLRIFENMTPEQCAIIRVGENLPAIKPQVQEFSAEVGSGRLYYQQNYIMEAGRPLMGLRGTAMEQAHNAENSMAAILACRAIGLSALLVQGIATSIDALSVGFTIADYDWVKALVCGLVIAIVTFAICLVGLLLGKTFGTKLAGKASIFGGSILIIIGIKIFVEGVFFA